MLSVKYKPFMLSVVTLNAFMLVVIILSIYTGKPFLLGLILTNWVRVE